MAHKRQLFAVASLLLAGTAWADGYGYFALKQADGTVTTLASDGLRITFSDGKLVAVQGGHTSTFALDALSSMCFTTQEGAGIASASSAKASLKVQDGTVKVCADAGASVALHSPNGVQVASLTASGTGVETLAEGLSKGVYIVNIDGKATKIIVE